MATIKNRPKKKKPKPKPGLKDNNPGAFKPGHRYSVGNTGGRPPHYETPEELQSEIDAYFEYIKGEYHEVEVERMVKRKKILVKEKVWDRMPENTTITGLTLFLGFNSRQSLTDYKQKDRKFADIIARGKMRIENGYESNLHGQHVTGSTFALMNMGWNNRTDVQNLGKDGKPADPPKGVIITGVLPNTKKDI